MNYRFNPASLSSVFAVPAEVADRHIRMAGSAQLKVLLWFLRHGGGDFDPSACGAAIGLSAADCSDAMGFWSEAGLLIQDGNALVLLPPPTAKDSPAPKLAEEAGTVILIIVLQFN